MREKKKKNGVSFSRNNELFVELLKFLIQSITINSL